MAKQKPTKPAGRPAIDRDDTFVARVGAMIRAKREAKKMSVAEAADAAEIPAPTWYHFEAGRHLRLERLPAIAAALKCKVRVLIPDE
jgi:transcriptional regulator with XRE-family HTH domain